MRRRMFTMATIVLTRMAMLATPSLADVSGGDPETNKALAEVRRATAPYPDIDRATADGYAATGGCVPGMGYHYVKSVAGSPPFPTEVAPTELDPTAPGILVYAPRADGRLHLVAVEYASWQPASLFGRQFDPPGGPPFYTRCMRGSGRATPTACSRHTTRTSAAGSTGARDGHGRSRRLAGEDVAVADVCGRRSVLTSARSRCPARP